MQLVAWKMGDEADNAQYYCEEARKAAEQAAGSAGFDGTAASVSAVDTHDLTGAGVGKKSTVYEPAGCDCAEDG